MTSASTSTPDESTPVKSASERADTGARGRLHRCRRASLHPPHSKTHMSPRRNTSPGLLCTRHRPRRRGAWQRRRRADDHPPLALSGGLSDVRLPPRSAAPSTRPPRCSPSAPPRSRPCRPPAADSPTSPTPHRVARRRAGSRPRARATRQQHDFEHHQRRPAALRRCSPYCARRRSRRRSCQRKSTSEWRRWHRHPGHGSAAPGPERRDPGWRAA